MTCLWYPLLPNHIDMIEVDLVDVRANTVKLQIRYDFKNDRWDVKEVLTNNGDEEPPKRQGILIYTVTRRRWDGVSNNETLDSSWSTEEKAQKRCDELVPSEADSASWDVCHLDGECP